MKAMARKTELREWLDREYRKDPDLKRRVDELVNEMEIEQGLVALREARGVSQGALARMMGISQPAIAKLESGRAKNIGIRTLARYVAALRGTLKIGVLPLPSGPRGTRVIALRRQATAKR